MNTNKIKVCQLIWSMRAGGAQQIVINYFRDLNEDDDLELELIVYDSMSDSKYDKEIREKGYNVTYLNYPKSKIRIPLVCKLFDHIVAIKTFNQVIKEHSPDIVHVHISDLLCKATKAIVKNKIPLSFDTLHSSPYRYKGVRKWIIKNAFNKHGVIPVCLTEQQARQAKEWYGFKDYEVVHNGIDIEQIKERVISKAVARQKIGIKESTFVVLGVGRLHPVKRFDFLMEVMAEIVKIQADTLLILAGDGEEKNRLIELSGILNISDKVLFAGNVDNVEQYYCAADVLAMPSKSEASPLVLLEAQICGLRSVISDGVPDEAIVSELVNKTSHGATKMEWVRKLIEEKKNNKQNAELSDYEVHNNSGVLKDMYLRRWAQKG